MELLEREHFQEMLHTGFRKTIAGEGHSFLICGEAGIGKSSLARNFLQEVEDQSHVFVSLCDSLFSPRPLGPVYDLAVQLDPKLAAVANSPDDRSLLFTRLVQFFAMQSRASIVLIEDIHWADEATLDFIKFFARRIRQSKCLLLLTYRDNEVTPGHPLRNVIGELPPGSFTRMVLPALSRNAVKEMASKVGCEGINLFEVSGGNPFYVTEILASYSPGIPDNIKDSILSIYNKLPEHTKNSWQLLSVIPEGLNYEWIELLDGYFPGAIENCLENGIIIIGQNRIYFKHELYRQTIEDALSPFRRLQLNKKILELFLPLLEEQGEIERIVHYAKNAGEKELVSQYAPLAAKQAASLGAHTEAAKLYLVAIEFNNRKDKEQLLLLYEAYTYECYLTNQIEEAIIYQTKALKIQEEKGVTLQVGNSLRFLSRLWWFTGRREESENYGLRAIKIFEGQGPSKEKAMAWSNIAQLRMLSDEPAEAIKWGEKAIKMAKDLGDEEILCHALNNVGAAEIKIISSEETGRKKLEESLAIGISNSYQEHIARAYTNLFACSVNNRDYVRAENYLNAGLNYSEEQDLDSWKAYILSWKARMLLETGNWPSALAIADNLCNSNQPVVVKITIGVVKATIAARMGNIDAELILQEAKRMAFETKEYQRILTVAIAGFEQEWLRKQSFFTNDEMELIAALMEKTNNVHLNLPAAWWMYKARPGEDAAQVLYAKYFKGKTTDPSLAIAYGRWSITPYEKAMLLFEGTADEKRRALTIMQELGAPVVCEKLKNEMRSSGIRNIPRGMRASTKSNPAQLTSRELDILQLLKTGAQDKEIASSLYISPKTVGHHISSILFKLDVPSRNKAVKEAETMGILK